MGYLSEKSSSEQNPEEHGGTSTVDQSFWLKLYVGEHSVSRVWNSACERNHETDERAEVAEVTTLIDLNGHCIHRVLRHLGARNLVELVSVEAERFLRSGLDHCVLLTVLESAGVKDVIAGSKGSSNAHNLVKATIKALTELRDAYTVAGERGISMDKVFNG